jgi:hypothetical protein
MISEHVLPELLHLCFDKLSTQRINHTLHLCLVTALDPLDLLAVLEYNDGGHGANAEILLRGGVHGNVYFVGRGG